MQASPSLPFRPGDPIPWFITPSSTNPQYHFGSVAGRHIVLLFVASQRLPLAPHLRAALAAQRALFDDERLSLFWVSADPRDESEAGLAESLPGIRVFRDHRLEVARRFGLVQGEGAALRHVPAALLLDPTLRVMDWFLPAPGRPDFWTPMLARLMELPWPARGLATPQAPVLILPRVFEPALCQALMAHYTAQGGVDSGYMKREGDQIVGVIDHQKKRRSDCQVEDPALRAAVAERIRSRINPELWRVFRFRATRMERYLVACYDSASGGFFRPHRDNDGDGHREFAVTINLNAEDYTGGDLCFPEYGRLTHRAPTGGACVFSCGLMHEALPVTAGRRYAFLPFLYDEAAAARRESHNGRYTDPALHYQRQGLAPAPGPAGAALPPPVVVTETLSR